jgi:hypothetical protein
MVNTAVLPAIDGGHHGNNNNKQKKKRRRRRRIVSELDIHMNTLQIHQKYPYL